MDKGINKKNILLGLLCVVVGIMAISVASYSSSMNTLDLKKMINNYWNVHLKDIDNVRSEGSPVVVQSPLIKGASTTVSYMVNLKPGDSYTFDIDVKNSGGIDAKLKSFVMSGITEEQDLYINYEVIGISKNQVLKSGDSRTLTVVVEYDDSVLSSLPLVEQELDLSLTLNFIQN